MAKDVEASICKLLMSTEFYLQVEESILLNIEVLLLAYMQFLKEVEIIPKMIFTKSLITNTKGESIFNTVKEHFKEYFS